MISVVTVTYNNFDELRATLDSIAGCEAVQSIVVNGGSCERTRRYLDSYSGRSISEADRGISDAFNKGIRLATGDAISFLNSGDLCLRKDYYVQADDSIRSGACDLVHANILFGHPYKGKIVREPAIVAGVTYFTHPSLIVARSLMSKVGFFDETFKIAMDFDYFCRLSNVGFTPLYVADEVVLMDGTGISSSNETTAIREVVQILRKHDLLSLRLKARYALMFAKVTTRRVFGKWPLVHRGH